MSTRYLKRFFKPSSIVVFGASERDGSMGGAVLQNLLESGYKGQLAAVNSQGYKQVYGVNCYPSVTDLPEMPELAIICSPPDSVANIIRKLGANMVKAVMILTGGLSRGQDASAESLRDQVREAAKPYGIRILGPDCMGMLVPGHQMNASYSHINISKGKVAYVGQSGLLGTAMIDWANGQEIGFSHFLTLGDGVDIDLSSIVDYLAKDPYTHAILLQIDRIHGSARNFISSIRAASRNKLVLILKSDIVGETELGTELAPGLSNENQVYDAALRRAGAVRVETSDQLYNALETLSRMKPLRGERLAIVCNGMGPAALAADRLLKANGELAQLTDETVTELSAVMPAHWQSGHPVDLHADASPERFATVTQLLSKDKNVDAVLVIHAPTRLAPGVETADALIEVVKKTPRNVLTCWMGRATAIEARNHFNAAGVTTFITPEEAVDAFMHMVNYHRNQAVMRQTPPPYQDGHRENLQQARELIAQAKAEQRDYLSHSEVGQLLKLYEIPVVQSYYCNTVSEVVEAAKQLEGTVAIKALHKGNCYPFSYDQRANQRWQDFSQDLLTESEVERAAESLLERVQQRFGSEEPVSFCVQRMKRGFQSMQMNVAISCDPTFGPVVLFGSGGFTVDVLADRHVMLPPLNKALAKELVKRSRIQQVIRESSYQVEQDTDQVAECLLKLSAMVVELPEIKGLEINPLLLNKSGLLAIDASISLGEPAQLSVPPYPEHLSEVITLKRSGRPAVVRAIRGEDEPNHLEFYNKLSPESIRMRYFYSRGIPTHMELANWTQLDYDREMAFIVSAQRLDAKGFETLGVVRAVTDADNIRSEFSVVIRDDLQGEGLGVILMQKIVDYCKARGTLEIYGSTLPSNKGMQGLAKKLGFKNSYNMDEDVVEMKMLLNEPAEDWQFYRLQS